MPAAQAAGNDVAPSSTPEPPDGCFSKQHRLLLPTEFKAVFDSARFKVSHKTLLLLVRPADDAVTRPARLGLVVAKKHARLAVQRNRIKRLLRESFRHHKHELVGLDIIALVRPGLWQMSNTDLRTMIEDLWRRLLEQKRRAAP